MNENLVGWYGKLPGLGDFVTKQLPEEFVKPWDSWLQEGMLKGRSTFNEQWEEQYLTFPIWRFLIDKNVLGDQAWTGLLIPSADRVGRLFPLTIAVPVPALSSTPDLKQLDLFLNELQVLARQLLEDDLVEHFEASANALMALFPMSNYRQEEALLNMEQIGHTISIDPNESLNDVFAGMALRELLTRGISRCFWWISPVDGHHGILRSAPSNLDAAFFVSLVSDLS